LLQKKKIAPEKMTKRASYASEEDYIATEKMTKASNHQTKCIYRERGTLGFEPRVSGWIDLLLEIDIPIDRSSMEEARRHLPVPAIGR